MCRTLGVVISLAALASMGGCGRATHGTGQQATTASPTPTSVVHVVRLEVGGMTCADCAQKIERQLKAVPGVCTAEVSLESHGATVACESVVADSSLIAAVRRAGPEYLGLIVR